MCSPVVYDTPTNQEGPGRQAFDHHETYKRQGKVPGLNRGREDEAKQRAAALLQTFEVQDASLSSAKLKGADDYSISGKSMSLGSAMAVVDYKSVANLNNKNKNKKRVNKKKVTPQRSNTSSSPTMTTRKTTSLGGAMSMVDYRSVADLNKKNKSTSPYTYQQKVTTQTSRSNMNGTQSFTKSAASMMLEEIHERASLKESEKLNKSSSVSVKPSSTTSRKAGSSFLSRVKMTPKVIVLNEIV